MSPTTGDIGTSPSTSGRHRADWLIQPISEQKQLAAGPPVDYSFKDLKTVIDLVLVEPTSGTARKPALSPDASPLEYLEALAAQDAAAHAAQDAAAAAAADLASPSVALLGTGRGGAGLLGAGRGGSGSGGTPSVGAAAASNGGAGNTGGGGGKQLTAQPSSATAGGAGGAGAGGALGAKLNSNSLRLCNNHLMSLSGLGRVMPHVLDDPAQLVWLDVSSNQLSTIEEAVLEFPSLQVLYYHGNNITNINDVLKLQGLPKLQKLTLHGNPIAEAKNYKFWVVAHLPGLRNMDFGPITKVERDKIETWFKSTKKRH
ncbi:hypothetical protein Agub_g1810 [Astrephomene gubernaculifera]|uniref:Leucine-rich repeat-containing protein 51 n=1 Tax=Astrephomene gubernaculifera TaxID=47775 RepID=A0AAD3DJM4_9CHLO|nr:hypothetical protein Agub_g1810 [Astrephomene gubernaculifera]